MKVLGIVCSPRRGGNTEIMMSAALAGARSSGAETELWTVAGKDLKPCDGCYTCIDHQGQCRIQDDMQTLYAKILDAQGLIFGSPSYFMALSAQGKIIIDRLFALYNQYVLADKVAGIITVAGSDGHAGVRSAFQNFFQLAHIFQADYAFGFGYDKGEVQQDAFGMRSAGELGKQVVSLLGQNLRHAAAYRRPLYRICRESHGVSDCPLRNKPPAESSPD